MDNEILQRKLMNLATWSPLMQGEEAVIFLLQY